MGSNGLNSSNKPHAVLIPYPAQGHISPFMQLAKLLRSKGFHITFVNTEFNHRRLIRSNGPDSVKGSVDFQFETIPDGLPESDRDATQSIPALSVATQRTCTGPLVELLNKINSTPGLPPVTSVVTDGVMAFAVDAAEKLGIPVVMFWTATACGFMAYSYFSDLVKRGIVPDKDENFPKDGTPEMRIDWIPGMPEMRLRDLPSFVRMTKPTDIIMINFFRSELEKCLKAPTIIINTFEILEHQVLEAIKAMYSPRIYTIGPFSLLSRHMPDTELDSFNPSLWKEDTSCLDWLEKYEPDSVVYVNYGCITLMTDKKLIEFAWGLANSKHPFLWIVRPDLVMGGESPTLPKEFYEEVKDRALLISWCPQEKVLRHPSVGAFLTHSGWNSTLESVVGGVPVICWPFFAEQPTNSFYSNSVWDIGMEVDPEVDRDDVSRVVKKMMESQEGEEMRKKAKEWKKLAEEATNVGGSSYNDFECFVSSLASGQN